MSALKEFADFIDLNLANLAETYAQLLAKNDQNYAAFSLPNRTASGRKLLKAVTRACKTETPDPLLILFDQNQTKELGRWARDITPPRPLTEIECLGQTLTPVVPNLEAGKFLWKMLAQLRTTVEPVAPLPVTRPKKESRLDSDAYRQLEERVKFLSYLVESSQVAQVALNQDKQISYVNPYFCSLYGYQPAEVVGQPFSVLIGEDDPQAHIEAYFEATIQNNVWRGEEQRKRKDGSLFPASISFTEILDEAGNIVTYLDVSRDISDRKQADDQLHQSRQHFQLVMDNIPQHIFWKDRHSVYLGCNQQFAQVAGVGTPENIVGKTDYDLAWKKEEAAFFVEADRRVMDADIPEIGVVEPQLQADGKQAWLETNRIPLHNATGNVAGILGTFADVTDQKQLEQRLENLLEQRTQQVQISTEVAQEIAAAPALDDLFYRVVDLVQERFGYYHAHVYTLENDDLVMQAGTGQAGLEMKRADHKIPLAAEKSLVARAARSGQPVLIPDVAQEPGWLPNPLLPQTKSELSVPIKLKDTVLGVLDIQSNEVAGLNQEDHIVMLGLCGQIALAINNRRVEAERVKVQAVLFESEREYKDLVDSLPVGIYRNTPGTEGHFLDANPALVEMFEADSKEEFLKHNVSDFYRYPEDRLRFSEKVQELGFLKNEELALLTLKGREIWGAVTAVMKKDADGQVYFDGMVEDITERKQTERNLTRALANAQKLTQEQTVLNELGQALTARLNIEQVLTEAHRQTARLVDATNFHIGLYEKDKHQISFPLVVSESKIDREITIISTDEGLAGYLVRNKIGLLLKDNIKARQEVMGIKMVGEEAKSWVGVPMMVGDDVLGVIAVQSHTTPGLYTEHDQELLTAIANQVAIAIQNARQFEETQRRAHRERVMYAMSTDMRKSVNPETILRIGVETIGRELGKTGVAVQLNPEAINKQG